MKPADFIETLSTAKFANVFNPYSDKCDKCDQDNAPQTRSETLLAMLEAAIESEVDSMWIGRDLGFRGGRRTGLALTDDINLQVHANRWRVPVNRPTSGDPVAERTATFIWRVLSLISQPVFLWNVFPLHPHEPGNPFTNRSHNSIERKFGEKALIQLVRLLNPLRLVAIGKDAALTLKKLDISCVAVRHPSYGGQTMFLEQINNLYNFPSACAPM